MDVVADTVSRGAVVSRSSVLGLAASQLSPNSGSTRRQRRSERSRGGRRGGAEEEIEAQRQTSDQSASLSRRIPLAPERLV